MDGARRSDGTKGLGGGEGELEFNLGMTIGDGRHDRGALDLSIVAGNPHHSRGLSMV